MPRLLKDLTINEVSSVDRGAGRGVKVMLMKRDETAAASITKSGTGDVAMTEQELKDLIAKSAKEAAETATAVVSKAFEEKLLKSDREIKVLKMSPAHKAYYDEACTDEATRKAFEDMKDEERDEHAKKNPVKKAADTVTVEELAKRDTTLAKVLSENADLKKRLDASDLEKAQASFAKRAADLGLTEAGDGELMRKAYSGDTEAQTAFEKRQATVTAALKKQAETGKLFDEFGTQHARTGSAYSQLMAKADEVRKADRTLTKEQAFSKVYTDPENTDLVKLYKTEDALPA